MPDPKDNAKMTGDTHPPEVEDTVPGLPDDAPRGTDGSAPARGQSSNTDAGRPGRDENAAGFVKDDDLSGGKREPR